MGDSGGGVGCDGTEAVGEEVGCSDSGLRGGEFGGFVVRLREAYGVVAGVDDELASNVTSSVFFLVETREHTTGWADVDIGYGYHARS